jgi:hypothetical protein
MIASASDARNRKRCNELVGCASLEALAYLGSLWRAHPFDRGIQEGTS